MRKKIIELIEEIKGINIEDNGTDYRLIEDLGMDSIEIMQLVVCMEDGLNIELDLEELDIDVLSSINSLANVFSKCLKA